MSTPSFSTSTGYLKNEDEDPISKETLHVRAHYHTARASSSRVPEAPKLLDTAREGTEQWARMVTAGEPCLAITLQRSNRCRWRQAVKGSCTTDATFLD